MGWSQGNLSVFITSPLMEEAKQLPCHLTQSEFTSELLPNDLPSRCPLSLILVSHWLRICHISQGDQEIHLASPRSLLPFLFLLVFYQTSGEVDVRLAVVPDDRNGKATWQLSYRPGSSWWCSCKPTSSAACPSKLVLVSCAVALKYALCVKNWMQLFCCLSSFFCIMDVAPTYSHNKLEFCFAVVINM